MLLIQTFILLEERKGIQCCWWHPIMGDPQAQGSHTFYINIHTEGFISLTYGEYPSWLPCENKKYEFSPMLWMRSNGTSQAGTVLRGWSRAKATCPPRSWRRTCLSGICLCLDFIERWQKHLCHKRTVPIYVGRTFRAEGNSLCQRNSHCCPTGMNCFPGTVIVVLKMFLFLFFFSHLNSQQDWAAWEYQARSMILIGSQIKDSRGNLL